MDLIAGHVRLGRNDPSKKMVPPGTLSRERPEDQQQEQESARNR
jgi:hypothetical protein